MKLLLPWVVLCLLFVVIAAFLGYLRPDSFRLDINNNTSQIVDSVRIFGRAVEEEVISAPIDPGKRISIEVPLLTEGDLRFEVNQGFNRIDTYIEENVRNLSRRHQQLDVNSGNRFIITEKPD